MNSLAIRLVHIHELDNLYLCYGVIDHPGVTEVKCWFSQYSSLRLSMRCITINQSELVPGSLLPQWNSMQFFATGSLSDSNSVEEEKFAPCTSKVLTHHKYCNLYVTMLWLCYRRVGKVKFPKKLTLHPTLMAKNTPLFLFPYMGRSLQIFAWSMPLHAHVFSFTHNEVVLSHFRCGHPKNQMKMFRF